MTIEVRARGAHAGGLPEPAHETNIPDVAVKAGYGGSSPPSHSMIFDAESIEREVRQLDVYLVFCHPSRGLLFDLRGSGLPPSALERCDDFPFAAARYTSGPSSRIMWS